MRTRLGGVLGKIPIPSPAMLVALLALFIAASGTAVAAISFTDANGNVRACGDNKSGVLRVLQSGQNCTSKETAVNWVNGLSGSQVADSAHADLADRATSANSAGDANTLDGKDASAFADKTEASGVDFDRFPAVSLQVGQAKSVGSITITAPADGFVVVTASGAFGALNPGGGEISMYAFLVRGTNQDGIDRSTIQRWTVPDGVPSSDYRSPFSITNTFPVEAGDNTYTLWGAMGSPGATNTGSVSGNMTAYYVKNQY